MHIAELEYIIEDAMRDAVQRHFPLDWKEDPITHDLMIRLRGNLHHVTLHGIHQPTEWEWMLNDKCRPSARFPLELQLQF